MRRDRISAIVFVQAETNIAYIYSGWNNQNKIFVPQREKNYGVVCNKFSQGTIICSLTTGYFSY